jgi:hypothetical protein
MLPLIIAGVVVGSVIGAIAAALSDDEEQEKSIVSNESDCSDEFLSFNQRLNITYSKKKQLVTAHNVLKRKVKDHFTTKPGISIPSYFIQGSYKHGTIIRKQDDTCDIDVGVYFSKEPVISPYAVHKNIVAAIGPHTNEEATIKNKCVRIYYSNQFHIDLPVYYVDGDKIFIGTGNNGWKEDNPKVFNKWLKEKCDENPQKIRLIKYFKAWVDKVKSDLKQTMPSGLALTIWISNHFVGDNRDDIAFLKTAITLRDYLKNTPVSEWQCKMPVVPEDNIIEKLKVEQRENFLAALNSLIEASSKIVALNTKDECLLQWKSLFGKWF